MHTHIYVLQNDSKEHRLVWRKCVDRKSRRTPPAMANYFDRHPSWPPPDASPGPENGIISDDFTMFHHAINKAKGKPWKIAAKKLDDMGWFSSTARTSRNESQSHLWHGLREGFPNRQNFSGEATPRCIDEPRYVRHPWELPKMWGSIW